MHARERYGLGRIPIVVHLIPRGSLHIPSLAGRNIRLIAQRLCLPHREFHSRQKIYCIGTDEEQMACRFPNPVPSGTRVPQWALIDITVRCYVFFNGNIFTAPFTGSLRTIGTQTSLLQSVVRTLSLSFSHYQYLTPTSCFLDSPEQAPGAILGTSGATVSASGTRSGATSSLSVGSSSTVKPTPLPSSNSSSNMGAIVGGAVGGVVVIALAAIAIGFFMRSRRSKAPAPVAPPFVGAYQPPPAMDEIQQPLTMDDGYTMSSNPGTIGSSMPGTPVTQMRIYVRVSCLSRFYVCSSQALSYPPFFLTLRTRMIHLRSLGTKDLDTKDFRSHRPCLLKDPYHRSMEQETRWPRCRPHGHRATTACLLSDFALRSHRITEKSETGMHSVILSI